MSTHQNRRLLQRSDLVTSLQLSAENIDWLVGTRQLRPLFICGEERYDVREVDLLIATYRQISERKHSLVH
jgi:hypothetical protein